MNEEEKNLTGKCDQLTQPEELKILSKYLKEGRKERDEHIIINKDNLELSGRKTLEPLESLPQTQEKLTGPNEIDDLSKYIDSLQDDREVILPEWIDGLVGKEDVKLSEKIEGLEVDDAIKKLPEQIDSLTVSSDIELETKVESIKGVEEGVDKLESPKEMLHVNAIKELEKKKVVLGGAESLEELDQTRNSLEGIEEVEELGQEKKNLAGIEEVELGDEIIKLNDAYEIRDLRQKGEDKLNTSLPDIYSVRDLHDLDQYYNNLLTYADKFAQSYPAASGLSSKIGSLISAYLNGPEIDEQKKDNFEKALFQALLPILKSSSDWDSLRLQNINDVDLSNVKEKLEDAEKEISLTKAADILPGTIEEKPLNSSIQNIPSPTNGGFLDTGVQKDRTWKGITPTNSDDLDKLNRLSDSLPAPKNEGFLDTGNRKSNEWKGITEDSKDDLVTLRTDAQKLETNQNPKSENPALHDWASSIGGGSDQVFTSSFTEAGNNNTLPPYKLGDYFNFWQDGKLNTNGLNINDYLRFAAENTVGLIPRSAVRAQRRARALALDEALALLVIARDKLEEVSKARRWRLPGNDIVGVSSLVSGGVLTAAQNLINKGIKALAVKGGIDYTSPQNRPVKSTVEWTPLSNKSEGTYYTEKDSSFRLSQVQTLQDKLNYIQNKKSAISSSVSSLTSKINEGKSKLSGINNKVSSISNALSSLIGKKTSADNEVSNLSSLISKATGQLDTCNSNIVTAKETLALAEEETGIQRDIYAAANEINTSNKSIYTSNKSSLDQWKKNNPGKDPATEWGGWSDYQNSATNYSNSTTTVGQEKTILENREIIEEEARGNLQQLEEEKSLLEGDINTYRTNKQAYLDKSNELEVEIAEEENNLQQIEIERDYLEAELDNDESILKDEKGEEAEWSKEEKNAQDELDTALEEDEAISEDPKVYTFDQHYLQGSGLQLTLTELCGKNPEDINSVEDLKKAIISSPYMFTPDKITSSDQNNSIVSTLDINNSWEVIFEPYYGQDNGYTSFLPHIEEINYINRKEHGIKTRYSKYLPISSFDLSKEEYNSKEVGLYSGTFAIPDIMTYRNELRLNFVDDQYKSLRRYFELCAKASTYESNPHILDNKKVVTEIDKNYRFIAPYRNITFRCIIYSMTPQKSTINKYDLLLVMLNMPEVRTGDVYAAGGDLSVAFSIVGENPVGEINSTEVIMNYEKTLEASKKSTDAWRKNRLKTQKVTAWTNLATSGIGIIT